MQKAEKIYLIIADVLQQIWESGAFHLSVIVIVLTIMLWFTASWWQPKLQQLTVNKLLNTGDWLYFLSIALIATLLFVSYASFYGLPVPRVHDENCYLLMGKTFAAGRITNDPHPLWQFFEHFHLLNQPTYMAKYPPAQAAFLAVGFLLFDQPIVGVWLSGLLAALTRFWMLRSFFSRNWSFYGTLLFLIHPTFFEWNQNYWGGNAALVGGALCIGSLFRWFKKPKISFAVIFAFGIAILANSRPFEGLLAVLPLMIAVVYWIIKRFRERGFFPQLLSKFVAPIGFILLINFVWMGFYNWKITGNVLKLPYSLYTEQYDPVPLFLPFSSPRHNLDYRHLAMKIFYESELENHYQTLCRSAANATLPVLMAKRVLNALIEFFSATFFIYLGMLLFGVRIFRANKKYLFFTAAFFFCLLLEAAATYNQNHYYAPFISFLIVSVTAALALASQQIKTISNRNLLVSFVLASFFVQLAWTFLLPLIFEKRLPDAYNSQFVFQKKMSHLPGKHLVLVNYEIENLQISNGRYHPLTVLSWVYNEPDIDQSKVIWANDMGDVRNPQLFDYFRDRHVWILGFDQSNNAKLLSCENILSPQPPSHDLELTLKSHCPNGK